MAPVKPKELISVFRKHGVSLAREGCSSRPSIAQASNMTTHYLSQEEAITKREGDVICHLEPGLIGPSVRRIRYEGEQETRLDALNVACAVYPSDDAHAEQQITRVLRALAELVRRHG
jgi:hypothetical protein